MLMGGRIFPSSSWSSQSSSRRPHPRGAARRGDYSRLRVPLSSPPAGQQWHHNSKTREWSIVAAPPPTEQTPLQKYAPRTANDDASSDEQDALGGEEMVLVEHVVLPTDTFAGLCLNYRIGSTQLRQSNCFSGSNLQLAPKKLYVPVSQQALDSGRIVVQDPNTKAYKLHALMAAFPELRSREAHALLGIADWNLQEALYEAEQVGYADASVARLGGSLLLGVSESTRNNKDQEEDELLANKYGFVVVAPTALPAGYRFVVSLPTTSGLVDNEPSGDVLVQVPPGGVRLGQRFAPLVVPDDQAALRSEDNLYHPPAGAWKDDVCNCLERACHLENWVALCCRPLLLGQVQSRNGLDILGREPKGSSFSLEVDSKPSSFYLWWIVIIVVFSAGLLLGGWMPFVQIVLMLGLVAALTVTRATLRRRFAIPGDACGDCFCAFCCSCCVVTQMARHTADLEHTRAGCCCQEDGLLPMTGAASTRLSRVGRLQSNFVIRHPRNPQHGSAVARGGDDDNGDSLPRPYLNAKTKNQSGNKKDPEAVGRLMTHAQDNTFSEDTRSYDALYNAPDPSNATTLVHAIELVESTVPASDHDEDVQQAVIEIV